MTQLVPYITPPTWLADPQRLARTLEVYRASSLSEDPEDTAERLTISLSTYYMDLRHAREFMQTRFAEDLASIVMDQVAHHRGIIRGLWKRVKAAEDPAMRVTAKGTMALARLYREIGAQEKMIEEILGMRTKLHFAGSSEQLTSPDDMLLDENGIEIVED